MNVTGHQAIAPDRHPALGTPLGHQLQIGRIVLATEERLLPPIPTLGHVMRQPRNDQSRYSSHAGTLRNLSQYVNISSCPRNPPFLIMERPGCPWAVELI